MSDGSRDGNEVGQGGYFDTQICLAPFTGRVMPVSTGSSRGHGWTRFIGN